MRNKPDSRDSETLKIPLKKNKFVFFFKQEGKKHEFPSGLVVRTLCSGQGTEIPTSLVAQPKINNN